MRNIDRWKPTKFVRKGSRLRASKDKQHLSVGSRLVADLVAARYDEALPQHARGRLLDMGCGDVPLYAAYKDHVAEITCIDWGQSLHPNEHLDLECDLTQDLSYPDGSFDTVLLSDVLEHLPEPERALREAARVLAPGGKLIMNVPFYYALHEQPHDYYRYTEFALRRLAEGAGFEVVELDAVGGAPEILADIVSKLLLGFRFGSLPAALLQAGAGSFSRSRLGSRLSAKTSARFPFGYFMVAAKFSGT